MNNQKPIFIPNKARNVPQKFEKPIPSYQQRDVLPPNRELNPAQVMEQKAKREHDFKTEQERKARERKFAMAEQIKNQRNSAVSSGNNQDLLWNQPVEQQQMQPQGPQHRVLIERNWTNTNFENQPLEALEAEYENLQQESFVVEDDSNIGGQEAQVVQVGQYCVMFNGDMVYIGSTVEEVQQYIERAMWENTDSATDDFMVMLRLNVKFGVSVG